MKTKGVEILKYTGILILAISVLEILLEILSVMHFDLLGVSAGVLGTRFYRAAGGAAVQILFSVVGAAAGGAAITLADKEPYNASLRWFGIALIVIYLMEGWMMLSQGALFSWIRVIVLLVSSAFYLYGAWLLKKEDAQAESKIE